MGFREEIIPASINGILFHVPRHTRQGGRATTPHSFIGRDDVTIEDEGRAPRRFQLQMIVIGLNYLIDRDDLIDLLDDDPGPYFLIHPFFGPLTVRQVGGYSLTESDDQGGMAIFSVTFMEHTPPLFPVIRVTDVRVVNAAALALDLSILSMLNRFNPGRFLGAVAGALFLAGAALAAVKGAISSKLALVDNITAGLTAFSDNVDDLLATPGQIVSSFNALALSVMELATKKPEFDVEADLSQAIRLATLLGAAVELGGFRNTEVVPPATTPNNIDEAESLAAVDAMVQQANLIAVSQVMVDLVFDSKAQAADALATMSGLFEDVLLDPGLDADTYEAFRSLSATVTDHLATQAQDLPNVATFTPPQTAPALVLAYRLFQDANEDADIIDRNKLPDANFVSGGVTIEVRNSV